LKPILFSRFAEEFKTTYAGILSAATIELYRDAFDTFIRLVGDTALHRLTPKHWDLYKTKRLEEVEAVTVNIKLRSLRAAVSTAVRWKMIESNAFQGLSFLEGPERDAAFVTPVQLRSILAVINHEDVRDATTIAFYTGMRRGEIVSLQCSSLDLAQRSLM
jgi:integrase